MADAYNLMVCAWHAQHSPKLDSETERTTRLIANSVGDWEDMAAYLALLASQFAAGGTADKIRVDLEQRNLAPV